jgi:hypothetical protein
MATNNTITPSTMKRMGFTLQDRGGTLWWERSHPTVTDLRFVVAASYSRHEDGIVSLPAECMTLHGTEDYGDPSICLFAGHCSEDQIGILANEMTAMTPEAVRIMVLALS